MFYSIDLFHDLIVKVFSVAEEEERLQKDKEGCRQNGLVEAVEQGWCPTFKDLKKLKVHQPILRRLFLKA
jgi:hypothetical protein